MKRKIFVKEERIRDIERAYQTKNIQNKVFISKPHNNLFKKNKEEPFEAPLDFVDESRLKGSAGSKRSRSLNELKDSKLKDFLLKGEKIKKIREMKIGEPMNLINPKKFTPAESSEPKTISAPMTRSISLSFLKNSPVKKQRS